MCYPGPKPESGVISVALFKKIPTETAQGWVVHRCVFSESSVYSSLVHKYISIYIYMITPPPHPHHRKTEHGLKIKRKVYIYYQQDSWII